MVSRRVVLQTRPISSVPPGLPFYKNHPLQTRPESTLPQLLIPLHFNSPRINVYKKPGEGVLPFSPKVLQLVTHNSRPTQQPRPACHAARATHHSSLATIPFRMIFFAHPHRLTTIESYSCKKHGRGVSRLTLPLFSYSYALLVQNTRGWRNGVCSKPFRRWIRRQPAYFAENWRWIRSAFEDN